MPTEPAAASPSRRPGATARPLDPVDRLLVGTLRANGRSTYAELAALVGLSPPAVRDRVARLEQSGVVTGYHAAIAPAALGLGVSALVGIHQADGVEQDDVAARLREVDEIEDCWFVAGDEAFVVKVRVPDVDALEHTLAVLRRIPGVARTRTTVVLSTRWEGRISMPAAAGHADPAGRLISE
ncbi:MAG TPA: Lrp/AsnC family transcriptional regulator [Mycobacteriales bacterium]|nr:Lrp/AsnC family transcriptional regulator [Mycobacteriales bacterium]